MILTWSLSLLSSPQMTVSEFYNLKKKVKDFLSLSY